MKTYSIKDLKIGDIEAEAKEYFSEVTKVSPDKIRLLTIDLGCEMEMYDEGDEYPTYLYTLECDVDGGVQTVDIAIDSRNGKIKGIG